MNTVPLVSKLLVAVSVLGLVAYGALFFTWPVAALFPLQAVVWIGVIPLTLEVLIKLFQKDFGADLLAVLALITSLLLHEYLAGSLIVLMLAGGQVLEQFAVRKASSVLNALAQRMPHTAHRQVDNEIEEVSLSDIVIGDKLVIFPHETTPVDGKVCEGNGHMDESYLTGEPYRVAKAPGSQVLSGAINGDAVLVIEAEKPVADSRYATIMKVMQEAENKRPALRRLGDQIGAIFTPVALLIACGAWFFTGDSSRFLSVLMVATPCPLLIAIPITIISAISLAAKQGIIIRDPAVLERLPTCRTAIFDKTGTLTYGDPTLTEILPHPPFNTKTLLQAAASLERYSKHPLANAFIERANAEHLVLPQASEVSEKPGQGLFGVINGQPWHLTSRQKIAANWPHLLALLPPVSLGLECVILCHDQYAGVFRLRDEARAEGKSFIGHLAPAHQLNKVILLSGDRASEVAYLAETLGIQETFAEQSPEEKVAIVRQETALAPTLFMGDGINDAPALATATVGLAFGSHNSVTSEAAGAVILENTLHKVDELLHISLALRRIAMQSAVGGMILSLIGMGLATVGLLSPVEGALAQEAIDVLAILNALRLSWQPTIVTDMAHHET
jgi:heavy metal translocating P-type ATPase